MSTMPTIPRTLSVSNLPGQFEQLAPLTNFNIFPHLSTLLHDKEIGSLQKTVITMRSYLTTTELSQDQLKKLKTRLIKWTHVLTMEMVKCHGKYFKLYYLKRESAPLLQAVEIARVKLKEQKNIIPKDSLIQAVDRMEQVLIAIKAAQVPALPLFYYFKVFNNSNSSELTKEYTRNASNKFDHLTEQSQQEELVREFLLADTPESDIALGGIIKPEQALTIVRAALVGTHNKQLHERLPRFVMTLNFDALLALLSIESEELILINQLIIHTDYLQSHNQEFQYFLTYQCQQFCDLSNAFAPLIDEQTKKLRLLGIRDITKNDVDELLNLREMIRSSFRLFKKFKSLINELSKDSQVERLVFGKSDQTSRLPGQIEINFSTQIKRLSEDVKTFDAEDIGCPFQIILDKFWECNKPPPNLQAGVEHIPLFEESDLVEEIFTEWKLLYIKDLKECGLLGEISDALYEELKTSFTKAYEHIRENLKDIGILTIGDLIKFRLYNSSMLKEFIDEAIQRTKEVTYERTSN
jgi:hypothetical protein